MEDRAEKTTTIATPAIAGTGHRLPEERDGEILSSQAIEFLHELNFRFEERRQRLLEQRSHRQQQFDRGCLPTFLPETEEIRRGDWVASPIPPELLDRRVEITGPPD